jgi:hypothetical protein
LNLHIVPQGHLNTLVVEPDLEDLIKHIQKADSEVEKIKHYLAEGRRSFFTIDDDGTLFFKNRLVVPRKDNLDVTLETRPGQQRLDVVLAARRAVSTRHSDMPRHWWSDMWSDKLCRGC